MRWFADGDPGLHVELRARPGTSTRAEGAPGSTAAPPSDELESADVEAHVSAVAKHPAVRAAMRAAQRALGEGGRRDGRPGHRHGGLPRRAGEAVPGGRAAGARRPAGRGTGIRGGGRRAPRAGSTGRSREPVGAGDGRGRDRHERSRRGGDAPGRAGGRRASARRSFLRDVQSHDRPPDRRRGAPERRQVDPGQQALRQARDDRRTTIRG